MSQPDQKTLDGEQHQLAEAFAQYPWFRGSYWGVPPGGGSDPTREPGWVVQVAAGHPKAETVVAAAGRALRLSGAPLRLLVLVGNPRAY